MYVVLTIRKFNDHFKRESGTDAQFRGTLAVGVQSCSVLQSFGNEQCLHLRCVCPIQTPSWDPNRGDIASRTAQNSCCDTGPT